MKDSEQLTKAITETLRRGHGHVNIMIMMNVGRSETDPCQNLIRNRKVTKVWTHAQIKHLFLVKLPSDTMIYSQAL